MNLDAQYQDALDYIYSFIENSLTHQENPSLDAFDLSLMFTLMEALGNPQNDYPTIHVAGSKGKGSVSAFCATALEMEGYKVGLYTSPHLRDFEERIQINWQAIPREDFVSYITYLKPVIEEIPGLNTFEIATALAFLYFSRERVDIAVIEVGLGGRLDATNVITPKVSVITALYLEHTKILGETLSQIAREKSGIIKTGVPVVVSPQTDVALQTVSSIAKQKHSPLVQMGVDYTFKQIASSLDRQTFWICDVKIGEETLLDISLLGQHQIENASTAFATLRELRSHGIKLSDKSIQVGLSKTNWPARFEVLQKEPPVIVDSAHNPDSARKLRQTLEDFFPGRPIIWVFGVSEDKNVNGMIQALIGGSKQFICTKSTHPRAMDAKILMNLVNQHDCPAQAVDNVGDALEEAIRIAEDKAVVVATGSIFVAATARIAWFENINKIR